MKKRFIFHPLLFALIPILDLYNHNKKAADLSYLIKPCLISFLITIIVLFVLKKTTKDQDKSSLLTSVLIIFFFGWHYLEQLFNFGGVITTLAIWLVVTIAVFFLIINTSKKLANLNGYFNMLSVLLILWSSINIGLYEFKTEKILVNVETTNKEYIIKH